MTTSSWPRLARARSSRILSLVGTAWLVCRIGRATSYTAVPEVGRGSAAAAGLSAVGPAACCAPVPEPRLRYRSAENIIA